MTAQGFTPRHGAVWLAETDRHAFQGNQTRGEPKTVIAIDTAGYEIEDHSDMEICRKTGRPYYILREDFIPISKIKVIYQQ